MAVCLVINAFLSGLEMAFVSVGKPKLRQLAKGNNAAAQRLLALRENPERTLSVLQVGITLVGVLAAAIGGAGAEEVISPFLENRFGLSENVAEALAVLSVTIPYTYISVVIGELVPKSLALRNPQAMALRGAKWLVVLDSVFSPIVSLLEWSTKSVLRIFTRRQKTESASAATEPIELDGLSHEHRQYVLNLMNISNKKTLDVYVPWRQVVSVDIGQPIQEVAAVVFASGHTRLPVTHKGRVVGILHTKEFLALHESGAETWAGIIRPMVEVQAGDSLLRALRTMQDKRSHMSIVVTQGAQLGIITMEDIFEEVVGEIYDEDDDGAVARRLLGSGRKLRTRHLLKKSDLQ